jgi:UDP-N-acetylmuramyl pentapeptide phosphotransferase/UDP-N-acetylglucosamine-1-phosphate transferase
MSIDGPLSAGFVLVPLVALCSALISWLLSRSQVLAEPNARSAHKIPIATAGGLGPAVGSVLGIGLLAWMGFESLGIDGGSVLTLLGLGSLAAMLGFADDVFELSAKWKFAAIGLLSLAMAILLGPVLILPFDGGGLNLPWIIGVFGTALWVFTLVNSVNFIDGADGVIPASALIASIGLAVLSALFEVWTAFWLASLLITALAGFIPLNMPRAQLFLGDTGSLFIGCWFAGTALILIAQGPEPVLWLMPLIAMPWLSDVLLTMAWRLQHKKNLLQPHNDHLYQMALGEGVPHIYVAAGMSLQVFATCILAILFRTSATSAFLAFAAAAIFALLIHQRARHAR